MLGYAVRVKKIFISLAFLSFAALCFPQQSRGAEIAAEGTLARKMQRGFLNIALSPLELSHELAKAKKDYGPDIPGWIPGFLTGTVRTACRMGVGAYELITLPLPLPRDYAPVMQPEFTWEYLEKSTA